VVDDFQRRILEILQRGPATSTQIAERLGISRQAAHRRLTELLQTASIERTGAARATRYQLASKPMWHRRFRRAGLEEHLVFREMRAEVPLLGELSGEALDAVSYVVTELVNNAIDHSSAESIDVSVWPLGPHVAIEISDDGIGVFEHVRDKLELPDELAALQEITKGKTTTAPERHSGEGLFFVSKVVDVLRLESEALAWIVDNERRDWAAETIEPPRRGTLARVELDTERVRDLGAIFEEYTEDFEFTRTRIVVELFAINSRFISRSEAKRVLHGLDKFREVILDFTNVESVGQGFADEVFRVWASGHPEVRLVPVNMNEAATFMVERARRR
jgi:DNA-binding Lrp family transcriptional regulator